MLSKTLDDVKTTQTNFRSIQNTLGMQNTDIRFVGWFRCLTKNQLMSRQKQAELYLRYTQLQHEGWFLHTPTDVTNTLTVLIGLDCSKSDNSSYLFHVLIKPMPREE